ncbi:MAG: Fur family transcriptional regulator [Chloroflexota bacterium]|nr:Fur family transcriptional regulator [Chloroflexota bacterium]
MQEWEQQLTNAGCRITGPRRAIMQVFMRSDLPLSPQEILERAQTTYHKLGLVTVYRTLNLLMKLNLIRRVHRDNGCHGYVATSPGHCHALICRHCGRAVEFPGEDDLHVLIERVEARTGYRVDDHLLQLHGLCAACQKR